MFFIQYTYQHNKVGVKIDKTEFIILGIIVIALIALAYTLIGYFFPSNTYNSQQGGFSSGAPVETNGSNQGGVVVPVGNGDSGYVNP